MKAIKRFTELLLYVGLFHLIFPQYAYAYIDPGTGSYLFQLILGVLFGLALTIKIYWKKIVFFTSNIFLKIKSKLKSKPKSGE